MAENEIKSINGRKLQDEKARQDIANISVPTKISELTNDSNFITDTEVDNKINNAQLGGVTNINIKSGIFATCKKWNVLGDSITFGLSSTTTYHKILKEKYSIPTVRSYGISGTQISTGGTNSAASTDACFCNRYVDMDNDADLVTVLGGINDLLHVVPLGTMDDSDGTTFYGALKILCEGLITKYPNATIIFLTPLKTKYGENGINTDGYNNIGLNLDDYINAMKIVCSYYCIPLIDISSMSRLQPNLDSIKTTYMPDGLHPNADGHALLANAIEIGTGSFIKTSTTEVTPPTTTTYSITNNLSNCTTNNSNVSIKKGESYSATISPNNNYKIDSISVTMGGIDISSTAVNDKTITINNVTGNIVIRVTTSSESTGSEPTNPEPTSPALISLDLNSTISGNKIINTGTGGSTYNGTITSFSGGSVTKNESGIYIDNSYIKVPTWDTSKSWTLEMVVDGVTEDDIDTSETNIAGKLFGICSGKLWYWYSSSVWEFNNVDFKNEYGYSMNKSLAGTIESINNQTIKMVYDKGSSYSLYIGETLVGSTTYSTLSATSNDFIIGNELSQQKIKNFTLKSLNIYDYAKK